MRVLYLTVIYFEIMTCSWAQQVGEKKTVSQVKPVSNCKMTTTLFRQLVTYAGSDLLMAIPGSFEYTLINQKTFDRSFILYQMIVLDSLYMVDSSQTFEMRWINMTYRNKHRRELFGKCQLEVWSFKKESEAYKLFSILKTSEIGFRIAEICRYMRMGRNIFIFTSGQWSNYKTINRLMREIESKYSCMGQVEYDTFRK
ncbi:hypothetical protein [Xanthocytophaga agilis]|uniref:Uncharacterized protein n=1 Tax=Xanthocytophaga agilis TaxID=3048010 RepID=A0AAE3R3J2_9BACT|nr:hypothetical protein [Xanthocytophaga agilis]MDJ1500709.1 hypothetical protein [Xanthocytophaga agilis]